MGAAVIWRERVDAVRLCSRRSRTGAILSYARRLGAIKSAVLLAGLNARGVTSVVESQASRDHTEKMLAHFLAEVTVTAEARDGGSIVGRTNCMIRPLIVPADSSSAAFRSWRR